MRIQAINNQTFNGLFVDKRHENNGNWKVEYYPYSWENKNTSTKANQQDVNILASNLPDNDKIYTERNGKKSARDILGTEFYYQYDSGDMRTAITDAPALNREDSLRVKDKKLAKFLTDKAEEQKRLEASFFNLEQSINNAHYNFNANSTAYNNVYFQRTSYKNAMGRNHDEAVNAAFELAKNAKNYVTLRNSIEDVTELKNRGVQEIKTLENARLSGNLIDISKRDIYDPNKALWDILNNSDIAAIINKFIALPHKTITVQELLRDIGAKVKPADIPQKAIQFIDTLIAHRL